MNNPQMLVQSPAVERLTDDTHIGKHPVAAHSESATSAFDRLICQKCHCVTFDKRNKTSRPATKRKRSAVLCNMAGKGPINLIRRKFIAENVDADRTTAISNTTKVFGSKQIDGVIAQAKEREQQHKQKQR